MPKTQTYNIYCDESCHLENDHQSAMVLGAVWCPLEKSLAVSEHIRQIKENHGLTRQFEIKWVKVTPSKLSFYEDLIDYFFSEGNLHFRALVVPDKSKLNHSKFGNDHDDWYYRMYFDMLKVLFNPHKRYHVYLDIKDTLGGKKVRELHNVLCTAKYDFDRQIIERIQIVRSHECEAMQLADLLIGCVGYINRRLHSSETKLALTRRLQDKSGYKLTQSTLLREQKVNIFRWDAQGEDRP